MNILQKLNFSSIDISNNIWVKYNAKTGRIEWTATFTLSGKIILKDASENIVLSTRDKSELESFLIREDRDRKINQLL